eukprot:m.30609 g.30609  ORF g.30609 m.30609 type:complete len:74 (+) comp9303_c0_seq1:2233-2454(+)
MVQIKLTASGGVDIKRHYHEAVFNVEMNLDIPMRVAVLQLSWYLVLERVVARLALLTSEGLVAHWWQCDLSRC